MAVTRPSHWAKDKVTFVTLVEEYNRTFFGVTSQLGSLAGDLFKLILNEGVEDGDGFGANASVRMHLLEDLKT